MPPKSRLEVKYQKHLVAEIERRLPGCFIIINDPSRRQGISDVLVLYEKRWGALEVKRSRTSPHRPNQDYYVDLFSRMSYAAFIYPENEEQILDELQHALVSC